MYVLYTKFWTCELLARHTWFFNIKQFHIGAVITSLHHRIERSTATDLSRCSVTTPLGVTSIDLAQNLSLGRMEL